MSSERRYYVVDRLEGDLVVLLADSGEPSEVTLKHLPLPVREGMVLFVPVARGKPDWQQATRDEGEERRRHEEGRARLERLR